MTSTFIYDGVFKKLQSNKACPLVIGALFKLEQASITLLSQDDGTYIEQRSNEFDQSIVVNGTYEVLGEPKKSSSSSNGSSSSSATYSNSVSMSTRTQEHNSPSGTNSNDMEKPTTKRILVFGCSKAGKTSMLNTITGEKFKVSDAAVGTTFKTQIFPEFQYNGKTYQFIDTAGLDEGDKGTVSSGAAISNLIKFIKNEGGKGFNLFVMVMAKGVISQAIEKNYELFINCMKVKEIPTLCVVTRCEDDDPFNKWVVENKENFENKYNMEFDYMIGSCFAQERDGRLANVYRKLCNESKENVMKMIEKTCSEKPYSIIQGGFFHTIRKIWNSFAHAMNLPEQFKYLNDRLYDFLKAMGVKKREAMELSTEIKGTTE